MNTMTLKEMEEKIIKLSKPMLKKYNYKNDNETKKEMYCAMLMAMFGYNFDQACSLTATLLTPNFNEFKEIAVTEYYPTDCYKKAMKNI